MSERTVPDSMQEKTQDDRFQTGASDYAAYLETPEGRLRTELAFANLQDFLSPANANNQMRALDIGCGTGAAAVLLAHLGFHVTLLDSSRAMLDIARRAAERGSITDRMKLLQGDAAQLTNLFDAASFDVIICHNMIEFVDDPAAVFSAATRLLRNRSAILSVVVRNQAGEVFKAAILSGDMAAAEASLTTEWGCESLYGGRVRLFTPTDLRAMMIAASLECTAQRGVRVLADYLPPCISRDSEYARIFELEKKLGSRPEFAAVARYTHVIARRKEHQA
jgi:S-adenosylmethionine-dependent methyltransferase